MLSSGGFTTRVWPLVFRSTVAAGESGDYSGLVLAGRKILTVRGNIADAAPFVGTTTGSWGAAWWPRHRVEWESWAPGLVAREMPVPGPLGVAAWYVVRFEVAG